MVAKATRYMQTVLFGDDALISVFSGLLEYPDVILTREFRTLHRHFLRQSEVFSEA